MPRSRGASCLPSLHQIFHTTNYTHYIFRAACRGRRLPSIPHRRGRSFSRGVRRGAASPGRSCRLPPPVGTKFGQSRRVPPTACPAGRFQQQTKGGLRPIRRLGPGITCQLGADRPVNEPTIGRPDRHRAARQLQPDRPRRLLVVRRNPNLAGVSFNSARTRARVRLRSSSSPALHGHRAGVRPVKRSAVCSAHSRTSGWRHSHPAESARAACV